MNFILVKRIIFRIENKKGPLRLKKVGELVFGFNEDDPSKKAKNSNISRFRHNQAEI